MSILSLVSAGTAAESNFSVTLDKTTLIGISNDQGTLQTSQGVTATPVNAPGPVTYEWTLISETYPIFPTSPTSPTTYFSAYIVEPGMYTAEYQCVATSGLTVVNSESIFVTLWLRS